MSGELELFLSNHHCIDADGLKCIFKDSGVFTDPEWDDFECVLRKSFYSKFLNENLPKFSHFQQPLLNALTAQLQVSDKTKCIENQTFILLCGNL